MGDVSNILKMSDVKIGGLDEIFISLSDKLENSNDRADFCALVVEVNKNAVIKV